MRNQIYKKINELRVRTGCSLMECKRDINICQGDVAVAYEFVKMKGQAVFRRRTDGQQWTDDDYLAEATKIAKPYLDYSKFICKCSSNGANDCEENIEKVCCMSCTSYKSCVEKRWTCVHLDKKDYPQNCKELYLKNREVTE
jgi:hypothetical protein